MYTSKTTTIKKEPNKEIELGFPLIKKKKRKLDYGFLTDGIKAKPKKRGKKMAIGTRS